MFLEHNRYLGGGVDVGKFVGGGRGGGAGGRKVGQMVSVNGMVAGIGRVVIGAKKGVTERWGYG